MYVGGFHDLLLFWVSIFPLPVISLCASEVEIIWFLIY